MKIANLYSHLNGYEYMLVHRKQLWDEIIDAITSIDANQFTKISKAKSTRGKTLYDQKAINKELEYILFPQCWESVTTPYYVTGDIQTAREIANIRDKEVQKAIIIQRGYTPFRTNNQVDFVKERVAVEVQFGKYFSVAYDLHVKHTFFFLRNDIDVGIEVIPTNAMCLKMDSGVPWFENEVANVIREGRSNPTVPIVMIGIEPEEIKI
ncbi:BglII/BstYI family type II restriction endonuclease [Oscillospiraceae bacterium 50-58]